MYDSSEGPALSIEKNGENPGGGYDGQSFTEFELSEQIDHGIPMTLGSPGWSTLDDPYPEILDIQRYNTEKHSDVITPFHVPPLGCFIHRQFAHAERTRLWSGSMSVKVKITNHFTDGNIEHKDITDDPGKVLEEQDRAYHDFKQRKHALEVALLDHDYLAMEDPLKEHEDYDDENLD